MYLFIDQEAPSSILSALHFIFHIHIHTLLVREEIFMVIIVVSVPASEIRNCYLALVILGEHNCRLHLQLLTFPFFIVPIKYSHLTSSHPLWTQY
jgi:hypothetical protein